MSLAPGARLGPYEVLAALGSGGMGEVYKARDHRLDRLVAVKILPPAMAMSRDAGERFEREARAISRLSHPNVCALFDVGREGETSYLVMELLDGETLKARVAEGPLEMPEVLRIGGEIAEALAAAARAGIAHRRSQACQCDGDAIRGQAPRLRVGQVARTRRRNRPVAPNCPRSPT